MAQVVDMRSARWPNGWVSAPSLCAHGRRSLRSHRVFRTLSLGLLVLVSLRENRLLNTTTTGLNKSISKGHTDSVDKAGGNSAGAFFFLCVPIDLVQVA